MDGKSPKIIQALGKAILENPTPKYARKIGSSKLKVLLVAVEASPYVRVGGVASVVRSLAILLSAMGHDVRIFIPKFGFIDESVNKTQLVCEGLSVPTGDSSNPNLICNIKSHQSDNIITYFLENMEYYELRANVYGYTDDPTRWALLNRGALEFILSGEFVPYIIHCNKKSRERNPRLFLLQSTNLNC